MFMPSSIPEADAVCAAVLQRCAVPTDVVDEALLVQAVTDAVWERLRELTVDRFDVSWDSIAPARASASAHHRDLSAYLSTRGAVGLALNDKLRSYVLYALPESLLASVRDGQFSRCDVVTDQEP